MGTRLRSWRQKIKQHPVAAVLTALLVVVIVLVVLSVLGYIFNWNWTGLGSYIPPTKAGNFQRGKTLWDWLQLLIIPAVLAVGGYLFNYTTSRNEQKASVLHNQTEREIASDNQREAALQAYIDKMSELLLHEKLRESGPNDEVRKIARVRTLTVLPRLDAERQGSVLQFLHESGLIDKGRSIVDLHGADLSGAILDEADLRGADLRGAILDKADLREATLAGVNLSHATLREADLQGATLQGATLREADLREAILVKATLIEADLRGAKLWGAKLWGTNLSEANLKDAPHITTEQLNRAKSLKGATMPDGDIHP